MIEIEQLQSVGGGIYICAICRGKKSGGRYQVKAQLDGPILPVCPTCMPHLLALSLRGGEEAQPAAGVAKMTNQESLDREVTNG